MPTGHIEAIAFRIEGEGSISVPSTFERAFRALLLNLRSRVAYTRAKR